MEIEVAIKGLTMDPITNMPIVVLHDAEGQRVLPIWVGPSEANAIALQIENVTPPRPMTHDLLRLVIGELRAQVQRVVVTDLKDSTFYALIYLDTGGTVVAIDARPSDAIALALRTKAPIFVDEAVLTSARSPEEAPDRAEVDRMQKWLESLDPDDLGKYKM